MTKISRRRAFVLGGAAMVLLGPDRAQPQPAGKVFRIGFLASVRIPVDVIVSWGEGADAAAKATQSIPKFSDAPGAIAREAIRQRVPIMQGVLHAVGEGGLMAHGVDDTIAHRREPYYVDRILRGDKPGDIPVEQPTRVAFHLNLKAAKAIGLTVPPSVLLQADRVIDEREGRDYGSSFTFPRPSPKADGRTSCDDSGWTRGAHSCFYDPPIEDVIAPLRNAKIEVASFLWNSDDQRRVRVTGRTSFSS